MDTDKITISVDDLRNAIHSEISHLYIDVSDHHKNRYIREKEFECITNSEIDEILDNIVTILRESTFTE